jgi:glyoxylase-like metal-dependent hydrolase (beta-lactamase superfamily II)
MQGSTVVINPPDGDMAHYLASLERLLEEDLDWLAPGHGFLIDQPHAAIRATLAHRRAREAQVLADVQQHGPDFEAAMVERVYASTDRRLHGVALRSLRAHLLKLHREGSVAQLPDGRWLACQ